MIRHLGHETPIARLVQQERAAGREIIVVPAGDDKAETLALFAEILHFPGYFGHNLDALADSLHSWAKHGSGERALIWDGPRLLRAGDSATYDAIVEILHELSTDDPSVHVTVLNR